MRLLSAIALSMTCVGGATVPAYAQIEAAPPQPVMQPAILWTVQDASIAPDDFSDVERARNEQSARYAVAITIIFLLFMAMYLVPSIIAVARDHSQKWAIVAVNIFAGWTGFGWVGALIWSVLPDSGSNQPHGVVSHNPNTGSELDKIERLASLRDKGVISSDEFDVAKKALLDTI